MHPVLPILEGPQTVHVGKQLLLDDSYLADSLYTKKPDDWDVGSVHVCPTVGMLVPSMSARLSSVLAIYDSHRMMGQ